MLHSRELLSIFLLALTSASSTVLAQTTSIPGNLANLPGLNEIQKPAAVAIQGVCASFNAAPPLPSEQRKLWNSCRAMVQTANQLATGNVGAFSLGLNNAQLRDAVQGVAPEEVSAQGRGAVETSGANGIGVRLFNLRSGVGGFTLSSNGGPIMALKERAQSGGGAALNDASGRLGGFINANYNKGDKNTTGREDGFDFKNTGLTAGLDYRFTDSFVAGLGVSRSETDADITRSLGDVRTKAWAGSLYGSYYVRDYYVDAHFGYSDINFDTRRNIVVPTMTTVPGFNTSATGSTNGKQHNFALGAGYDIKREAYTVTPYASFSMLKLDIDAYSESEPNNGLGLDIGKQTVKSTQSVLGVKLAKTISTASGVLVPYVSAEWNHEYKNDSRSLTAKYTNDPFNSFTFAIPTDSPDRNYFTVGAGISGVFANGLQSFVSVATVLGLKDVKNYGIVVGLRKEF